MGFYNGCVRGRPSQYINVGQEFQSVGAWSALVYVKQERLPSTNESNQPVYFTHAYTSPYTTPAELFLRNLGTGEANACVRIIYTWGGFVLSVYGSVDLADGKPHVILATYDGSGLASGVKIYIDGVLDTNNVEFDTLGAHPPVADGDFLLLNQLDNTPTYYVDHVGGIYFFAGVVKNQAFATQWGDPYGDRPDPTTASAAWTFLEGTGLTAADSSGNGKDGALTNSSLWSLFRFQPSVPNRYLQSTPAADHGDSTADVTSAFPSNVAVGSLIPVKVVTKNSGITVTVTDTLGNIYQQVDTYQTSGTTRVSIWWAISEFAGANTIRVHPSASAYVSFQADEFSGPWEANPVEDFVSNAQSSSTPSAGTLNPAETGRLVIGVGSQYRASTLNTTLGGDAFIRTGRVRGDDRLQTVFEHVFTDYTSITVNFEAFDGSVTTLGMGVTFVPLNAGTSTGSSVSSASSVSLVSSSSGSSASSVSSSSVSSLSSSSQSSQSSSQSSSSASSDSSLSSASSASSQSSASSSSSLSSVSSVSSSSSESSSSSSGSSDSSSQGSDGKIDFPYRIVLYDVDHV